MSPIASCVTRECSVADHPALHSQHADVTHRFIVLHLESGHAKTIEYAHFDPDVSAVGTVRVHDGAQSVHAFVDARQYDTTPENALDFEVCFPVRLRLIFYAIESLAAVIPHVRPK